MEPLTVKQADFYPKENAQISKTQDYDLLDNAENCCPILRRGCTFQFAVNVDRNFDPKLDAVRIEFSIGK